MKRLASSLLVPLAVAGVLAFAAPADADSLPCARHWFGREECEGHMGALVRAALDRRSVFVPASDVELGRAITDLCVHTRLRPELSAQLAPYRPLLMSIRQPFCG